MVWLDEIVRQLQEESLKEEGGGISVSTEAEAESSVPSEEESDRLFREALEGVLEGVRSDIQQVVDQWQAVSPSSSTVEGGVASEPVSAEPVPDARKSEEGEKESQAVAGEAPGETVDAPVMDAGVAFDPEDGTTARKFEVSESEIVQEAREALLAEEAPSVPAKEGEPESPRVSEADVAEIEALISGQIREETQKVESPQAVPPQGSAGSGGKDDPVAVPHEGAVAVEAAGGTVVVEPLRRRSLPRLNLTAALERIDSTTLAWGLEAWKPLLGWMGVGLLAASAAVWTIFVWRML
jgi:hypothetical protein